MADIAGARKSQVTALPSCMLFIAEPSSNNLHYDVLLQQSPGPQRPITMIKQLPNDGTEYTPQMETTAKSKVTAKFLKPGTSITELKTNADNPAADMSSVGLQKLRTAEVEHKPLRKLPTELIIGIAFFIRRFRDLVSALHFFRHVKVLDGECHMEKGTSF